MLASEEWRNKKTGYTYFIVGQAYDANNVDPKAELQVVYRDLNGNLFVRDVTEFRAKFRQVTRVTPGTPPPAATPPPVAYPSR